MPASPHPFSSLSGRLPYRRQGCFSKCISSHVWLLQSQHFTPISLPLPQVDWCGACLLLRLHLVPCPTHQHMQILSVPATLTNLLSFPWVYSVTSHLIIPPCNILFSTPKFPLVGTYVSVKSEVTQRSLPSLTSHLPTSSHSAKCICSRAHTIMARLLCDYLIHVSRWHHPTVSSKRIVTVLLRKRSTVYVSHKRWSPETW